MPCLHSPARSAPDQATGRPRSRPPRIARSRVRRRPAPRPGSSGRLRRSVSERGTPWLPSGPASTPSRCAFILPLHCIRSRALVGRVEPGVRRTTVIRAAIARDSAPDHRILSRWSLDAPGENRLATGWPLGAPCGHRTATGRPKDRPRSAPSPPGGRTPTHDRVDRPPGGHRCRAGFRRRGGGRWISHSLGSYAFATGGPKR